MPMICGHDEQPGQKEKKDKKESHSRKRPTYAVYDHAGWRVKEFIRSSLTPAMGAPCNSRRRWQGLLDGSSDQPDCEKRILSTFDSGMEAEGAACPARATGGVAGGAWGILSSFCQALLTCRIISIWASSTAAD